MKKHEKTSEMLTLSMFSLPQQVLLLPTQTGPQCARQRRTADDEPSRESSTQVVEPPCSH